MWRRGQIRSGEEWECLSNARPVSKSRPPTPGQHRARAAREPDPRGKRENAGQVQGLLRSH